MMGADDGFSEIPPVANQNLQSQACWGTLSIPPNMVKCKIQAIVRNKRNQMHKFNGFDDESDVYHDTRTNYLMEQEPSLTQDQADGDGYCCC
jgi:hypothetical protein